MSQTTDTIQTGLSILFLVGGCVKKVGGCDQGRG